jgi:exopolysaccharide biosynthesis polyprenyl glycosylphosphotransferase
MGAPDSEDLDVRHVPRMMDVLYPKTASPTHTRQRPELSGLRDRAGLPLKVLLLPACDLVVLAAAAIVLEPHLFGAVYGLLVFAVLDLTRRHKLRICLRLFDEVSVLVASAFVPVVLLLPWLTSIDQVRRLVLQVTASLFLLVVLRAGLYSALRAAHRAGRLTDPTLIVGTGGTAREVGDLLVSHREFGLRPVGFIDDGVAVERTSLPVLGGVAAMPQAIRQYRVRTLIVAGPDDGDADVVSMLRSGCLPGVATYVVPRMRELARVVPSGYRDDLWGVPLTRLRHCGLRQTQRLAKRAFDVVATSILLVLMAPVLMLLVLGQLLIGGLPVIFRQDRVTYMGRIMRIMKFRTVSRPVNPDSQWTVDDADCSRLGRWLRSTHLDELPQLFNVIRGDMSLVGPRPERPFFTAQFASKVPGYGDRHRTSTGITGWAQVHGLNGDTSISERVQFDNYYIEHWSLWLDISILVRTLIQPMAGALIFRRGRRKHAARISSAIETGGSGKSASLASALILPGTIWTSRPGWRRQTYLPVLPETSLHEDLARTAGYGARRHGAAGCRALR